MKQRPSEGPRLSPRPMSSPPPRPENQPNIVLIMLDDAGWGDIHPDHSPVIDTPRIDRLAGEGMSFGQMYAGSSVCSPSRAALLTGRYPTRVGIPKVIKSKDRKGLSQYERTLPELLKQVGYRTGIFGKWHLGHHPRHNPLRHGFDRFFGVLQSNDQRPHKLLDGRRVVEQPFEQRTLTRRFTDEAISFIRQHRNEPFFAYVPHTAPHIPLRPEKRFQGQSRAGIYGDVLENVDFHIGRLLDTLDEVGVADNTIVILSSDNGPWFQGSTNGQRGNKTTSWEGGIHVPFFVRWPGRVAPGSTCGEPASFIDLLPTLVGIGGGEVPKDRPIDGIDIRPVLHGRPMPERRALFFFNGWELDAVRSGRWKLRLPHRKQKHKKQRRALFDVVSDPREQYDLTTRYRAQVHRLQRMADQFSHEIRRQKPRALRRARNG